MLPASLDTSRFRIVDAHAHLGENRYFDIPSGYADGLIAQMDRIGIAQAAISAMIGLYMDCRLGNDWVAQAMERYPGRFIGMATVSPGRPEEIIPELTRCFDGLQMSVIKLHPNESEYPMSHPVYEQIYPFAQERGLPILNHDWQSPARLMKLAARYPRVRFIQAHSAGNWDGRREDDYFRLARDCENVYVDICASPIFYGALEKLVDLAGPDHILFGSDFPFLNLGFGVGKVMIAYLTDEVKQKIFADNFLRLLETP